ncbi:MAG TPA: pitrilysin family protein [Brevundimonas sp.]|uniref:M16 family metallopeptidase n=1 Tax=Brevundimonas sp. TaxID=1871086 RepID=UPI002620934D|nr:pitrilysin family protein [Brevundimonas sp.]HRO31901.1 pitrilysin family protein [Brevundimonas sp.]
MKPRHLFLSAALGALVVGMAGQAAARSETAAPAPATADAPAATPLMPVERFQLPNGLNVVFHIDRSDPVVAVVLAAHVGSAREEPGRTGFAHLFEHLFFLDSENLGPGGLDAMSARIGGSGANGSTSRDLTDYLQTVPNDALEKMIWAEADKLGYFINTVTDAVLAKEKQVVKNEKRLRVDNQPYGHAGGVISEALYPADHPYSWQVIGSLADLDAATLDDVRGFYRRWYTPGNATLVIAGEFDPAQARGWIEKYFGEIPAGAAVPEVAPRPAGLQQTVRLMHEDAFAQLPELTLAWPTVERNHPDEAALDALTTLLTDGKDAPLNAVLIDEAKLTSQVGFFQQNGQIAGEAYLSVRAFADIDLDRVQAALADGFARFEAQGVDTAALERVKTMAEADFYARLDSVLGKGAALARYDAFGGDADQELARLRAVTADDVMRVYRQYFVDRPHVVTSFVPRGKTELAIEGSTVATVAEEAIVQGAEAPVDARAGDVAYERTASSFDRTVEPPAGPAPVVTAPTIWTVDSANGLSLSGIVNAETPLATFDLSIEGGRLFDDPARPGVANLVGRMLDRGTANRTPAELENAFKALGARVNVGVGDERIVISGRTLDRNLTATLALVEEMLLQPRWDPAELELARAAVIAEIQDARARPDALAGRVMSLVANDPASILSRNPLGTEASVGGLTMDDLKAYHRERLIPGLAHFRIVSPSDQAAVAAAANGLATHWAARPVTQPPAPQPVMPERSQVYFYDVPGAKQSALLFGYPALNRSAPDFYPATVMNYRLGGGGFASRLTQQLREGQGYTYGVRSGFDGGDRTGAFALGSNVRTNVTLEAAQLARSIIADYGATFTDEDLAVTRSAMSRSRARAFETARAKLGVLAAVGELGLPADYLDREAAVIDQMTVSQIRDLAERYLRTDAMYYVVVGDAATQAERLEALGYGAPVMMNDRVAEADR